MCIFNINIKLEILQSENVECITRFNPVLQTSRSSFTNFYF